MSIKTSQNLAHQSPQQAEIRKRGHAVRLPRADSGLYVEDGRKESARMRQLVPAQVGGLEATVHRRNGRIGAARRRRQRTLLTR